MLLMQKIGLGLGALGFGVFGLTSLAQQSPDAKPVLLAQTAAPAQPAAPATQPAAEHPRLGVRVDKAAIITEVLPGLAGERAGLKVGDQILQINHQPIADNKAVVQVIHDLNGAPAPITVMRDGRQIQLTVNFEASAQAAPPAQTVAQPAPARALKLAPLALKPGFVVGRAVFEDGRPIQDFTVTVLGFDAVTAVGVGGDRGMPVLGYEKGHNGSYTVQIKDTFRHTKPVDGLVDQIKAKTQVVYKGESYDMDLCPLDGKKDLRDATGHGQLSAPGLTRDFVLKVSGLIPGRDDTTDLARQHAYYGQSISVTDWDLKGPTLRGNTFKGANLVFTLTPQGPLLDGSMAQTVTRQLPVSALGTEAAYLLDVPIGPYSVQGQIVQGGVSKPLSLHWAGGDRTFMPSVTLIPHPYRVSGTSGLPGAYPKALYIEP